MKLITLFTSTLLGTFIIPVVLANPVQKAGAGIEAKIGTGYGLYAVTMKACGEPGAISSFYTYAQNGVWTMRWHELDIEFTPGFAGLGHGSEDKYHAHLFASGSCYKDGGSLPDTKNCELSEYTSTKPVGSDISYNLFDNQSVDASVVNVKYPWQSNYSNNQVFTSSNDEQKIFTEQHTYYFYYTPQGVFWTKDLKKANLGMTPPQPLPHPDFLKKNDEVVDKSAWMNTKDPSTNNWLMPAFWYDKVPLNPENVDHSLSADGALMKMSINLWDGRFTTQDADLDKEPNWGGPRTDANTPENGVCSTYEVAAYYPLETPVKQAASVSDPMQLNYGQAVLLSDFKKGEFLLNGKQIPFTAMWQIYSYYIWPLGQLDERNIICGRGEGLELQFSDNYSAPRQPNDSASLKCEWLKQN